MKDLLKLFANKMFWLGFVCAFIFTIGTLFGAVALLSALWRP